MSLAAWTSQEDRIIMDGVARLGCKWRDIAKLLNNRSDSSVRNRWQRLQRSSTPPVKIEFVPQARPAADTATSGQAER